MSSYRSRGVDRHAAEQLLAGAPVAIDAAGQLAAVLRAAAAPAHPEELAGEQAALAAFRDAAVLDPVPVPPRPSMLKRALAKLLTVKALIIMAAAGSTGIVFGATGGALPGPWSGTPADSPSVQRSTSSPALTSTSVPVTTLVIPTGQPSDAGRSADAGSDPAPSMVELCRAYTAQVNKNPGKALDNPAFGALVTAAGGAEKVPAYCAGVAADQPHGKPSDHPTPTSPGNTGDPPGSSPVTPPGSSPATLPGRTQAPVNPAQGVAPAVPSSGARMPSPGG